MAWEPGFATRVEVITRADDLPRKPRLMEPALRFIRDNYLIMKIAEEIPAVMRPEGRKSGVPIIFLRLVVTNNKFRTYEILNFVNQKVAERLPSSFLVDRPRDD